MRQGNFGNRILTARRRFFATLTQDARSELGLREPRAIERQAGRGEPFAAERNANMTGFSCPSAYLACSEPDIPQNRRNNAAHVRCLGVDRHYRAAGSDRRGICAAPAWIISNHVSCGDMLFAIFEQWRLQGGARLVLLSTKASACYFDAVSKRDVSDVGRNPLASRRRRGARRHGRRHPDADACARSTSRRAADVRAKRCGRRARADARRWLMLNDARRQAPRAESGR